MKWINNDRPLVSNKTNNYYEEDNEIVSTEKIHTKDFMMCVNEIKKK